ncbi:protein kinase domain-containing protein [Noviherbaspirillum saxi]|uniref:Protein kinase domain-containing protein n=1 Tax=Noviherbaspirillum saxi TaxID=2320863 RepID=A0A3A3FYF1_9BURK|nr:hypothetical protein [Noviherbaspirillum saxi]RJF92119.1 hypothetical protein D3871_26100 [Noviherbaspirillum saxi]
MAKMRTSSISLGEIHVPSTAEVSQKPVVSHQPRSRSVVSGISRTNKKSAGPQTPNSKITGENPESVTVKHVRFKDLSTSTSTPAQMPNVAENGYYWLSNPFIPAEEFPGQEFPARLSPAGQELGSGGCGTVTIYRTPDPNHIEFAAKSASGLEGEALEAANRMLHKESHIYGRLKEWAGRNKEDSSYATMQKNVVKIYGMAGVLKPDVAERRKSGDVTPLTAADITPLLLMEKGFGGLAVIKELSLRYACGKLKKRQFDGIMQWIGYQVLQVIELFGKAGLIHGDIKPDNFIFDRETGDLKVIDFGISGELGVHANAGTHTYAPPGAIGEGKKGILRTEQFDVFCVASSLLESMEFDLTTVINEWDGQWNFKHARNWQPNEGLTLVAHSKDVAHTNPYTGLKERLPGHYIDIKNNVNTARSGGFAYPDAMRMMQSNSDQAPDARVARNLMFFKDAVISHDEARSLIKDMMDSLDPVEKPAKQDPLEFPQRPNLPPAIYWIATQADLLKVKYELESAAQTTKGKHSSDTIRELIKTCADLLGKLNDAANLSPQPNNNPLEKEAVASLEKELGEQGKNITSMAIRKMSELANVEKDLPEHLRPIASKTNAEIRELLALPEHLHPIVFEVCALLLQQKNLNIALNPTPSKTPESDKPIDLKLAPHRWHYRTALQAWRHCAQLIQRLNPVAMNQPQHVMDTAKVSLNTKLTALQKSFVTIIIRLSSADVNRQMSSAGHLLSQDELDVQLLIEQGEALLSETHLAPKKSASVARRVQMMIDTLVKHDARIGSLITRSAGEQNKGLKGALGAMVGRLEKSKENLTQRLKRYKELGASFFHGTEKRINELLSEIFSIPGSTFGKSQPDKNVREQDFALAFDIWSRLNMFAGRTDPDGLAQREKALTEFSELAPRMAAFVARMRPVLEELGLPNDFGKNHFIENKDISHYMPSSLRELRERLMEAQYDHVSKTTRPGLMEKVKLARRFLDQHIHEDMELAAHATQERKITQEETDILRKQQERKKNLKFPDPLPSQKMEEDSATNSGELDAHKRAHVRRMRPVLSELELLKRIQKTASGNEIPKTETLSVEFSVDYVIERENIGKDVATLLDRADEKNGNGVEAKLAELRKHGVIPEDSPENDVIDLSKLNEYLALKAGPTVPNEILVQIGVLVNEKNL